VYSTGNCCEKSAAGQTDNVACDKTTTPPQICQGKKGKTGAIVFTMIDDWTAATAKTTYGEKGKQLKKGDAGDIVCYFDCKDPAAMKFGAMEFDKDTCAEIPSVTASPGGSDSASPGGSGSGSGKSSDLASMILAISIAIPLANIYI